MRVSLPMTISWLTQTGTSMTSRTPSYKFLLRHFRAQQGLFVLGAGASAGASESGGEVRFGHDFLIAPALDYVRGDSFPVSIPVHSELSRKIINVARGVPLSRVFSDRIIRPGMGEFPYEELVQRMPGGFARLYMKHDLSKARYSKRPRDNYTAFRLFYPAMLMNYNLDGLATDCCSDIHHVLTPHGTIPAGYGSPEMVRLLAGVRDYDLHVEPDGFVISVPESPRDQNLGRCLDLMATCSPLFIAIIGYTFGRSGSGHDDWISLDRFKSAFHCFAGNVYVIEPRPEPLREMIADGIEFEPSLWRPCLLEYLGSCLRRGGSRSSGRTILELRLRTDSRQARRPRCVSDRARPLLTGRIGQSANKCTIPVQYLRRTPVWPI